MRHSVWFYLDSVPFTTAVLRGETSLGGSESACLMLAEALAARGHDVHVSATRLEDEQVVRGVTYHHAEALSDLFRLTEPDVFCALRTPEPFRRGRVPGKLNLLWNQDLLLHQDQVLPYLAQVDRYVYVSAFHRQQWAEVNPMLGGARGWVTRNGIRGEDVRRAALPSSVRERTRFLYLSRPERGLDPLLQMWPAIKARVPEATLAICRYQSMYDGEGSTVAQMCAAFDAKTRAVQERVGGIETLGHLTKPQLYEALQRARLVLYPGVADFAETSCLAAIEAQACGTPIVASWKGALPETVHPDAGVLIEGDAASPRYQAAFLSTVEALVHDDARYADMQAAGRAWALPRYDVETIAAEWEAEIDGFFEARYAGHRVGVLRQLLHWDNHVAAQIVAEDILADEATHDEAQQAKALCARVIRQEEQTAEHYATYAEHDVEREAMGNGRFEAAGATLVEQRPARVLDLACGNGSFALWLARQLPEVHIVGIDYSPGVLALARRAIAAAGLSDRVTFQEGGWESLEGTYDAIFCGEFLEHIPEPWRLLDVLEQHCAPDGQIVLTTPCGPFFELLDPTTPRQRGHLHSFTLKDMGALFGQKRGFAWRYLGVSDSGMSARGTPCGYWVVRYTPGGGPAGRLDYADTIVKTRPYQRVVASMIVRNGVAWLTKCLLSIRQVVDRIVVLDTGSIDGTQDLARSLGAEVYQTHWPENFSVARNAALDLVEADADWVLWIDADEHMDGAVHLRSYLTDASPFHAYCLRQNHLMVDVPAFHDKPMRVFRAGRGVRFYGVVHEQPEEAPDQGITPALELPNVDIIHLGYHRDQVRLWKMTERNLSLLTKALRGPSPRRLDYVLAIRDAAQFAWMLLARDAARAVAYARMALRFYREHRFDDPADKYHAICWPYYQVALRIVAQAQGQTLLEVDWGFSAGVGRLGGRVAPQRFVATSPAEIRREVTAQLEDWLTQLTPSTPRVAPVMAPPVLADDGVPA